MFFVGNLELLCNFLNCCNFAENFNIQLSWKKYLLSHCLYIVKTLGADFVFAEDYQLRPLSEVKAFIQENKHLPEIKSAQEMQEKGVGVNELQTQLLQKIEELTLYLIQQEERIKALEAELNK